MTRIQHIITTVATILFFTILFIGSNWFTHAHNTIRIAPATSLELIIKHARFYGVSEKLLIDLATIESNLCKDVVSKVSSARGCFQFVRSTWDRYCSGSVMSENDNIRCAAKMVKGGKIGHWLVNEKTRSRLVAKGYNF